MSFLRISIIVIFFVSGFTADCQSIYKTPSGAKYHLSSCRMVKNVSEEITVQQAIQLGLEPCRICRPGDIYAESAEQYSKAKGESKKTVQCKGYTKKGTRCLHRTSIANGYCYQHQPG